jgi:hypothetical protein
MSKDIDAAAVSPDALSAFRNGTEHIIRESLTRSLAFSEEAVGHGDRVDHIITKGMTFTCRMLDTAIATGERGILDDQIIWAHKRLTHDGVRPAHIRHRFQILLDVIQELLPQQYAEEIIPYIEGMIQCQEEVENDSGG